MLPKGELIQLLPIASKNVEINIAVDTGNFAPIAVLPKLPLPPASQNGLFLTITSNPERILVEMTSEVSVVKLEIGIENRTDTVMLVNGVQPDF